MYRRLALWIVIFVFAWLVISRFAELSKLGETFTHGIWAWVAASAALQVVYYVVQAAIYQVSFATVLVRSRLRELIPVLFSSIFVNVAVPTGGMSGVALFIDNAVRYGQSAARTAAGVLLVLTADFSAFTVLLGLGLTYLALRGEILAYQLTAAAILMAIIGGLAIAFILGLWKPYLLLHLLRAVQRAVNKVGGWVRRPHLLDEHWAPTHAMDFSAASAAIAENPLRLSGALGVAMVGHLVNLASVYVLFLAFGGPVSLGTLVAGYAMGNLFWIVSITPQGVGVVEGVMALVYSSLGVPLATAAAVVLVYRGLGFWLPLAVGFVLIRRLRLFRGSGEGASPIAH